jgi:hypothetical protein
MNLYNYVGGDPVNWVDPWGLNPGATAWAGAEIGAMLGGPVGAVAGGAIGFGIGIYAGQQAWDQWFANEGNDQAPPAEKKRPRRFNPKDRDESLEECKDENGDPRCVYCGSKLHTSAGHADSYEADHGNPYSQGGESTKENLYPSCRTCNRSKGGKTIDEWLGQ